MRDVHSFNQLITAQSKHLPKTQHKPAFMLQAGATAVNPSFKVRLFVNKNLNCTMSRGVTFEHPGLDAFLTCFVLEELHIYRMKYGRHLDGPVPHQSE